MTGQQISGLYTCYMSSEEKAAQIGEAAQECEAAKVNFAHIIAKMQRVSKSYKAFGDALADMASDRSGYPSDRIKVVDGFPKIEYVSEASASSLMDGAALATLLQEKIAAQNRKEKALEALKALGITSLT